jgi:ribonucleoside-diphosphate reductase alpha subunit
MITKIRKRSGDTVDFDVDKLTHWAKWAGVVGVDWFAIAAEAYAKCPDECTTKDLQNAMIASCAEKKDTAHALMAGRLLIGDVYKQAFGGHDKIPSVLLMYRRMIDQGFWEEMNYSFDELMSLEKVISHKKDLRSVHSVVHQITSKYANKDVEKNIVLESPQFVWMRMALGVCKDEDVATRMQSVVEYYNDFSGGLINAPTPDIVNLGTPRRGYASCCVFKSDDNSGSLAAGDHIAYTMTVASAGIGNYIGTRSKGDGVRNNTIKHAGKLPYYRATEAAVHANLQGGRGGASTNHFNCLDPEVMTLLRLRHPTTVAKERIGGIDYSFGFHPLLAEKSAKNEKWMLVSLKNAPELYEALYTGDVRKFVEAYNIYEQGKGKRKYIHARVLSNEFLKVQEEIGREYEHNILEMNRHTPFKCTIYSSNLCQEIGLPTTGYRSVEDLYKTDESVMGEIGLCNLGAIVAGRVSPEDYEGVAYRTLKMVDNVIDLMDYPFPHLKMTAQARRSAGIGITNLAHDMASRGLSYTSVEGKAYMHRLAEMHSYWLHKASVRLAKERGKCKWYDKTKYSDGWLLIDTYCKQVDNITSQSLLLDWEGLRKEIAEFGMRNSVLEAYMPVESSSVAGNTTNSIYPLRSLVTVKTSGTNKTVFIAPDMEELKGSYEIAWDIPTKDMTEMYAIFQKFTGQGISADYYRKFKSGEPKKISAKELMLDWFYRIKCGLKTKYYSNTAAGSSLDELVVDSECESCKL